MKVVFIGADTRTAEMASLSVRLRWPDSAVIHATAAAQGLELVEREWPDIVLLHPDFSDMVLSGAIQELRGFSNVPLLVLGHQNDEMEAVSSLEIGADDYVRLPCDLVELTARIWALLRRAGMGTSYESESPVVSGRLLVNPATYEAFVGGQRLTLTTTEFRLLYLLVKSWGIVVSRATLERTLWGDQVDSYGLVKKYIQRLRHKLGDDAREPFWIASVHGVGYRFIGPTPKTIEASVRQNSLNVSPEHS
ncbi:MAG TPA: response regulator transcription factor [Dehalococcoidia bacterium]|nr:response regulator transcription factor [Dehalococcoidia bacterium]